MVSWLQWRCALEGEAGVGRCTVVDGIQIKRLAKKTKDRMGGEID